MRLFDVKEGGECAVLEKKIRPETAHRLEMLGMTNNVHIYVLGRKRSAMIIKMRGTRFAIGRGIAQGIEVETV